MRLVADKKRLKALLTASKSCLPLKPQSEYEANPSFLVEDGVLYVTSMDFTQNLRVSMPVECPEAFRFSCDYKKLEKVLTKTEAPSVELLYDASKGSLRVSASGASSGFVEVPSIPFERVPVFDGDSSAPSVVGGLPGSVLKEGMDFATTYLPAVLERNPKYDFVQIRRGIVYAANGANRRGFFASPSIVSQTEIKVLKKYALTMPKALTALAEGQDVEILEGNKAYTFRSVSGDFVYQCIRARSEPSDIPLEYLVPKGGHTLVELNRLSKMLEKVVIPEYQSSGVAVGVRMRLESVGGLIPGSATLGLSLVTAKRQEAQESVECTRVGDPEDAVPVEKVVDFRMLKDMIASMPTGSKDLKFFINDPEARYFKIQGMLEVGPHRCVALAAGSYARVAKV